MDLQRFCSVESFSWQRFCADVLHDNNKVFMTDDELLSWRSDHNGRTLLHVAVSCDQTQVVEWLLNRCPTLLQKITFTGQTALHIAKTPNIIRILLRCCDAVFIDKKHNGLTALQEAVIEGNVDKIKLLLDHKPEDIYAVNTTNGWSLLHYALDANQHESIEYLLAKSPVLAKHVACLGENAMHHVAFLKSHKDALVYIRTLFQIDPEMVHARNMIGNTPFLTAMLLKNEECVRLFLEMCPAVIHHRNDSGYNPLFFAWSYEMSEFVLRTKPQLIDEVLQNGDTPLHEFASTNRPRGAVQLLLNTKPELIFQRNNYGTTVLGVAKDCSVFETLFLFQPDLHDRDSLGNTALHLAVMHCKDDTIKLVFAHQKHSLMITNTNSKTPYHVALECRNAFAVCLFQPHITVETAIATYEQCANVAAIDVCTIIKQGFQHLALLPDLITIIYTYLGL